jgi:trehalose 6-phosphate synthase/phosphatase
METPRKVKPDAYFLAPPGITVKLEIVSSRIILVSNRLSVSVQRKKEQFLFTPSMGGLATGLQSLDSDQERLWVGWSGLPAEELDAGARARLEQELQREHGAIPVHLGAQDLDKFYYGFCNDVIWPLFHYFPSYAVYRSSFWEAYRRVNALYCDRVLEVAGTGDTVWVHDYQLMLLPQMLREKLPEARLGFFLHIPFPSFEVFRLLPWREQILEGILGADLVGFHTFDYARHFISSVRRLLGAENNMGYFQHNQRLISVDTFPMGIDYDRYAGALATPEIRRRMEEAAQKMPGLRIILSVDRLDYTKGIVQRLKAYDLFLTHSPQYRNQVQLLLIVVPSRTRVPRYLALKKEVEELVGGINGRYGTIGWTPIRYFYRGFPYDRLASFYGLAEVLLVTTLRDGMNLVAKEFVAVHRDGAGVLILSETAGTARELGEALLINPNNLTQIAHALQTALEMGEEEQRERMAVMNRRLSRYHIGAWARDFLGKLDAVRQLQREWLVKKLDAEALERLRRAYRRARRRLLILDYDGTLAPTTERPRQGAPGTELLSLLGALGGDPANELVISTGRAWEQVERWFGSLPASLIAEHGAWLRPRGEQWQLSQPLSDEWKEQLLPIFELYTDRTPGSAIEEKSFSLAWHYRQTEPELATMRLSEFKDTLFSRVRDLGLEVTEGEKVLEVMSARVDKGRTAARWLERDRWEFVLAAGNDADDEALFSLLPAHAFSIRVGMEMSAAQFFVESCARLRQLLEGLLGSAGTGRAGGQARRSRRTGEARHAH